MTTNEDDKKYRQQLIDLEQKIHEGYDKTLITLSAGALGISFAFIKDVVGPDQIVDIFYILIAWSSWAISLICILSAFYTGTLAYRHAIKKFDRNDCEDENPGGCFTIIMQVLNFLGGISFVIGVISFITFSYKNLGG